MTDDNRHLYELATLGFTIVKGVFDAPTVAELRAQLQVALLNDQKWFADKAGKKADLVVDLTIHHPAFLQALDNEIMQHLFSQVFGDTYILYSYTSTILQPGTVSAVHTIHVDTNKFIPGYVTGLVMTVALDDFTDENGATLYLPGSHNCLNAPSAETFAQYAVSTARSCGDALFFNPRVFHRAGENNSDRMRYGLTIYATRAFMKPRFDFPRMIPQESLANVSERVRRFLGFHARVPESLEQYYLPPEQRMYKV